MREDVVIPILLSAVVVAFPVALILFIVKYNQAKSENREAKRAGAFQGGSAGRARIVELRRAAVQRSDQFDLWKILLEVFPDNSPSFSTAVVWEIEPLMVGSLQIGSSVPVKINPDDARQVFPNASGMRYSYTYQHAYLGIEDDFEPRRVIAAQELSPVAPRAKTVYRKRSKTFLWGMPLWEVATNLNNKKYAPRAAARAVIAIGDSASGLIAIGTIARGVVAVGQVSFGLVSIGGISCGAVSFGLTSVGLASLGVVSLGLVAAGGVSLGLISAALLPFGSYVFGRDFRIPVLSWLFEHFKTITGLNFSLFDFVFIASAAGFAFFMLTFIGQVLISKMLSPNDNSLESPRR